MSDHVHMMISVPSKSAASQAISFAAGKAPYAWRGCKQKTREISLVKAFARENILYRVLATTTQKSTTAFGTRKGKTSV